MSSKTLYNRMGIELKEHRKNIERYKKIKYLAKQHPLSNEHSSSTPIPKITHQTDPELYSEVELMNSSSTESLASDKSTYSNSSCTSSGNLNDSDNIESNMASNIASWALRNKVPHNHINDLLRVLKESGINDLPKSAKTLLRTPNRRIDLRNVYPGEYFHFGIQNYLISDSFSNLCEVMSVNIDIGIDGMSLFKSSKRVLWPIIGAFSDKKNMSPFLIGCYSGMEKPKNINNFLEEFIAEAKHLMEHGVKVGKAGILKQFKIRLFICDAPARAFVTGTQYHSGKNSCPKCTQVGIYANKKVVFRTEVYSMRTDDSYRQRTSDVHQTFVNDGCNNF